MLDYSVNLTRSTKYSGFITSDAITYGIKKVVLVIPTEFRHMPAETKWFSADNRIFQKVEDSLNPGSRFLCQILFQSYFFKRPTFLRSDVPLKKNALLSISYRVAEISSFSISENSENYCDYENC